MTDILAAVLPPIGVLVMFVIVIRGLVLADRRERRAQAKIAEDIERTQQQDHTHSD